MFPARQYLQSGQFKHPCKIFIQKLLFVLFFFNFVEKGK